MSSAALVSLSDKVARAVWAELHRVSSSYQQGEGGAKVVACSYPVHLMGALTCWLLQHQQQPKSSINAELYLLRSDAATINTLPTTPVSEGEALKIIQEQSFKALSLIRYSPNRVIWEFWFRDLVQSANEELDTPSAFIKLLAKRCEELDAPHGQRPMFCPAVDTRLDPILSTVTKRIWHEEHGYLTLKCDAVHADLASSSLGYQWRDSTSNKVYLIDHVYPSDLDAIMSQSTIDYEPGYLQLLLSTPPFCELARAIREVPDSHKEDKLWTGNADITKTFPPVSWCLTHQDLAVGLLGTVPSHRKQGLALRCGAAVSFAQMHAKQSLELGLPVDSHCYILPTNHASLSTMKKLGFKVVDGVVVTWTGLRSI